MRIPLFAGLAAILATYLAPAGAAGPPAPGGAERLSEAETRRRLGRRIGVDLPAAPLHESLRRLAAKVPGVDIVLDADVGSYARNDRRPGNRGLKAVRIPAQEVLTFLCEPNLVWVVERGRARVIRFGTYHHTLPVRRCEVADLLTSHRRGLGFWDDEARGLLPDLIKRCVLHEAHRRVAAWRDVGGSAEISVLGDDLAVAQTPEGHACVAEVLALIRRAQGTDVPPAPVQPADAPAPVREALAETRRLLDLGAPGGYVFAPAHDVEGDVPLESLLAMIETVQGQPGYPRSR
jgi:hypothetical protein